MKATDDYTAKFEFWALSSQPVPPQPYDVRIPGLTVKRFDSYEDFNAWKREQLLELAELPPEEWQIPRHDTVSEQTE
jgi:hypothetical protein